MTAQYSAQATTSRHVLLSRLLAWVTRGLESLGTVSILFIISGAVFPLLRGEADPTGLSPPTPIDRASSWCAYLFVLLQVALRPHRLLRTAIRNPLVPGLVLVAFLSVAWSDDPATSLKEAGVLCIWTLFGFYLVSRYDTQDLLRHLGVALGAIVMLSLIFGLVAPDYGISHGANNGMWRGVFLQKNQLGQVMLLACIVFVLRARSCHGWLRAVSSTFLALAMVLIVLSRSKTALVILCALAVITPALLALRRGGRASVAALCALLTCATAAVVVVTEREPVLSALGKDVTLTGRSQLWAAVGERIAERPLLGYGYKAFWEAGARSSEAVRAEVGWDAPHSHNGFMDLWVDLGLLGLSTFLAGYVVATSRAWAALRTCPDLDALWPMTILIMTVPQNMVASPVYENRLSWVLFVAVSACGTLRLPQPGQEISQAESWLVASRWRPLARRQESTSRSPQRY